MGGTPSTTRLSPGVTTPLPCPASASAASSTSPSSWIVLFMALLPRRDASAFSSIDERARKNVPPKEKIVYSRDDKSGHENHHRLRQLAPRGGERALRNRAAAGRDAPRRRLHGRQRRLRRRD